MVRAADEAGLTLMIDHTYCYTPAVQYIHDTIARGVLGHILYIDSIRINLGLVQPDVDVFWDLAPHDLSILDYILPGGLVPEEVSATGADPLRAGKACVGYVTMPLANGGTAHVNVNWMSPTKIRQMVIGGSHRTLVWDDLNPQQRVAIHDRGIDLAIQGTSDADQRRDRRGVLPTRRHHRARIAGERGALVDGDRVRRRDSRAASTADGRKGRSAGALRPRGRLGESRRPWQTGEPRTAGDHAGREFGVSELQGASVLVTGGAGTIGSTIVDQLLDAGVGRVRILDNLVRGRRENLATALDDPRTELVEGDLRDIDLVHDVTKGSDLVFHQAAIRITQCAEEPRLALEVLVDGTFTVLEAAAATQGGQGDRRVVRVGVRDGRTVPHQRATTTTTTTPSTARRRASTRACCAASARCTAWTTWRCGTSTSMGRGWMCTASTPRCWCAGWSALPTASRR